MCSKYHLIFHCDISSMVTHNDERQYTTNIQAVFVWVATGGGAKHLEGQLVCLQMPSVTKATFIQLEHHLGTIL